MELQNVQDVWDTLSTSEQDADMVEGTADQICLVYQKLFLVIFLTKRGWLDLNHNKVKIKVNGNLIEARGTDDAHLELDNYPLPMGAISVHSSLELGQQEYQWNLDRHKSYNHQSSPLCD